MFTYYYIFSNKSNLSWHLPIHSAQVTSNFRNMKLVKHWLTFLPFQRFQVLFNSLFKVLFIFPSRYLFTISLSPIFSFRWNLPPNLSCNPKQLDSLKILHINKTTYYTTGVSPSQLLYSKRLCISVYQQYFFRPQFSINITLMQIHNMSYSHFSRPY